MMFNFESDFIIHPHFPYAEVGETFGPIQVHVVSS